MTVPVSDRLSQLYVGNGSNIRFDFNFRVFKQEDTDGIAVRIKTGTEFESLDKSNFIVNINQENNGGFIEFLSPPSINTYFYVAGETPLDQLLDITNYDNFYPDAIERAFDKLTAILQEWSSKLTQEQTSRILADIQYDTLAMEREVDLENRLTSYVNSVMGILNPKIFDGITDRMVITKDGRTQRDFNDSLPFWTNDYSAFKQETAIREEKILKHVETKAPIDYVNTQLDLKAPLAVTNDLQQQKVDKVYFDSVLSSYQNGAIKTYASLAAANTDITNIALNTKVSVLSETEGGDYYKASSDATSLTKSPWDTLQHSKTFTMDQIKSYNSVSSDFFATINLVNPAQATAPGYFAGKGIAGTTGTPYVYGTDYYPAKVGQKFWTRGIVGGQVIQYCRADKSAIWNGSTATDVLNGILTIPEKVAAISLQDVAYIRIGCNTGAASFTNGTVAMGVGDRMPNSIPPYNTPYSEINNPLFKAPILAEAKTNTESLIKQDIAEFKNLTNPAQNTTQGFFGGTTISGTGNPSYINFYVGMDYYPATVGTKFWMKGVQGGQVIQFCRADKTAIWNGTSNDIVNGIYTVPAAVGSVNLAATAYIRVGTNLGPTAFSSGKVAVGYGDKAPIGFPQYDKHYAELTDGFLSGLKSQINVSESPLTGKKWAAMGDSITNNGSSYANVLAGRFGAILTKYSRDGARVHRTDDADTNLILSEEYLNIPTDNPPDLITIAGGTNDGIATLGVFSDRTKYTFYGALHVILAGLRSRFTDARIAYIAPIPKSSQRYIEGDMTNTPYLKYKAIKEVCAYYGVPVWNGNTEFGANPSDSTAWANKYMPDTLHPSIDGHVWYANRIENFILSQAK